MNLPHTFLLEIYFPDSENDNHGAGLSYMINCAEVKDKKTTNKIIEECQRTQPWKAEYSIPELLSDDPALEQDEVMELQSVWHTFRQWFTKYDRVSQQAVANIIATSHGCKVGYMHLDYVVNEMTVLFNLEGERYLQELNIALRDRGFAEVDYVH